MSDILTRLIGPIPASYTSPVDDGVFAHPGGPAPRCGNYAPILVEVPLSWLSEDVQTLVTQPGTCWGSEGRSLHGAIYRAQTTDTLLVLDSGSWYVAAPARPCRRAVTIAVDVLQDRSELVREWRRLGTVPDEDGPALAATTILLPDGLLRKEIAEAQRIHAEGGATYRASLPWETEPTYPAAEPVDGDVEIFRRRSEDE